MTRRSTGPITAEGKAVSSQNARRHGLNAPPEEYLVTAWFNLILNNGEDALEEPNASDARREAALRLAIAEARYHRALHKVEAPLEETSPGRQIYNQVAIQLYDLLMEVENLPAEEEADSDDIDELKLGVAVLKFLDVSACREQRLFKRYLGEARAQRKKALRAWCAFNRDDNLNSRNKPKLQSKREIA